MNKIRFICVLTTLVIILSTVTGCSQAVQVKEYNKDTPASSIPSQTVAENTDYALKWDDDAKCVLLECLATEKIWSNIPYDYILEGGISANVNSTLNITVANNTTLNWDTIRGYTGAVEEGRVFCEKIENGLRVTYCFDTYEISIPVNYILRKDSLLVSIDSAYIQESGSKYSLVSISLAPFMCAVQNATPDSYLFVPSGAGALMYAKEDADGVRKYAGEVYGDDASRSFEDPFTDDEAVRLPVFGAKDGESAILGILEEGAGSVVIEAEAGNNRTGYSTVYPTIYFRGYDQFRHSSYTYGNSVITRISKELKESTVSVGYYPLSGDDADYNGMAKSYRRYLQTSGLQINAEKDQPYNITLLGGVLTTSSILGIPKKTLEPMTTFSQSREIIEELSNVTGSKPSVRLMGFGESGINFGEIAGGFKFSPLLGGKADQSELETYCEEKSIAFYTDFDLIQYSQSGSGFSYNNNSAKNSVLYRATQHAVTPIRLFDEDIPYRLLGRKYLANAVNILLKKTDKLDVSGISLSSLGNFAYSDYSAMDYACKGNIEQDVRTLLEQVKASGHSIASGANAYAAAAADVIFDVPVENGSYNVLDVDIPFYQMVFRGTKPLYSSAINFAADAKKQMMLSVAGGSGLGFTLTYNFDVSYMEMGTEKLYATLYSDNKALIQESLREYEGFYNSISGASIQRYELLKNNVSKTTFSNGIGVYVNHANQDSDSPIGTLKPYSYKIS